MADDDGKRESTGWRMPAEDESERQLDAALAEYAVAEPRAGLEQRILANLQAERERRVRPAWWRWTATAVAVVIIIAVFLEWRAGNSLRNTNAHHPSKVVAQGQHPNAQGGSKGEGDAVHLRVPVPVRTTPKHGSYVPVIAPAEARLGHFPSPQPLSEQEKMLADYIKQFRDEAVLVARARMEELKRDREEEGVPDGLEGMGSPDSDQRINQR